MIGRQIAQYKVLAKLGEGGMGEVYRALDTRLDREVALKVLPAEFAKDPERLARFRREARVLASLNHAHIAALHGLEEDGGQSYLAMELVEGLELAERLQHGPIELEEALDLARQFAEGLESAHEQNVVHRDLKPANLKITPEGQLKILDFGLARAYLGDPDDGTSLDQSPTITAALTGHGVILGTAAYMSPEQARGRKVDQRTDIWAFGAILFEMLSGERLFTGETVSDTMAAVLRADPPWDKLPDQTPRAVIRLLERCLERDARRRLRDIGEARVRLERWRDDPSSMDDSNLSSISGAVAAPGRTLSLPWVLSAILLLVTAVLGWRLVDQPVPVPRVMHFEIDVEDENNLVVPGIAAAISPDGSWLVWNTRAGLRVRGTAEAESRLLPGTTSATGQCFSPDSQWIAFDSRGTLLRVSVTGGTPIPICPLPTSRGYAWVDDITIIFSPGISTGLHMVDLRDGAVHPLTELDSNRDERSHRWPTAVPGQRAVLFECQFLGQHYDQSDVRYISLDGGEQSTVYRGGAAPRATGQGQLLFARGRALFAVDWDGAGGTARGLPIPVLSNVSTSVGNQEDDDGSAQYWLDDHGTLLYLDAGGQTNGLSRLAWHDRSTGAVTPFGPVARHGAILVSPDQKHIAVQRERDGNTNLYILGLESGNEIMLTRRESVEYLGAFSPDSSMLYWSQTAELGSNFEIWRRPVDGSTPPEFVFASPSQSVVWPNALSPDGRYLMMESWMGPDARDLQLFDLEDPDATPVLFAGGPLNQFSAKWYGPNHVLYLEGGPPGSLTLRQFPDTGNIWTLPETDEGYYEGFPVAGFGAVIAGSEKGIDLIELTVIGGSVQIKPTKRIYSLNDVDLTRIGGADLSVDGDRAIVIWNEEAVGRDDSASLVVITGWVQEIAAELATR